MKLASVFSTRAYLLLALSLFIALGSCADGYESPDGFDVGVSNQVLTTPDSLCFSVSTDGTVATISWPLVMGCAGYEVTMMNVDDPANPYVVDNYDHYIVDGCSMTANIQEDSKYSFQFKVVGNTKFSNKDGEQIDTTFTTLVPSLCTIPNGADIYTYLTETFTIDSLALLYRQANALDTIVEAAIDLEIGGEYTMSGPVDFEGYNMTFRGNKAHPATVVMKGDASFYAWSGLKLKFLRFDETECTANALIQMSNSNLPESILSQNLGYARNGSPIKGIYTMLNPVFLSDVWVKNLPKSLISDHEVNCQWWNLTVNNCIIQVANEGTSNSFIHFDKSGHIIKEVIFKNSTIYNIYDNTNTYFLRYGNQSNANVEKCFGNTTSELGSSLVNFSNCTFSRIYSGQKWWNNINGTGLSGTYSHCIFHNLFQPFRRSMEKGGSWKCSFNFFYNANDPSDSDYTRKDTSGSPCASLYDPKFGDASDDKGNVTKELDLTQPNGGVSFRSDEYMIRSNAGGDPRWNVE